MKKFPSSIDVKGVRYKIKQQDLEANNLCGHCDPVKKIITINSKMSLEDKLSTVLHELGHAVISEVGIRQTPGWSIDIEEIVVENFSNFMVDKFKIAFK